MLFLKRTAEAFILPPGIFILAFLIFGTLLIFHKRWVVGGCLCLGCLSAWAMTTAPISDMLLGHLESGVNVPKKISGDVIIVLGAGIRTDMPDKKGTGSPTEKTTYRLFSAAKLHNKLKIPILFTGGGSNSSSTSSNDIITRTLLNMGVPKHQIIVENKSKNTRENAANATRICAKKGFKKPILVTSAYHLKRSYYCFNRLGIEPIPFPAGFYTWEGKKYSLRSYLPGNFYRFSLALKEIIGLKVYQLADKFQTDP